MLHNPSIHTENIHRQERGRYLGDLVYGANDGIITTFAVISGATGATLLPGIIIILGLANLVGDGISMGLSNFLSLRSRRDFEKTQRRIEEHEIETFPEKEREETAAILRRWGIGERELSATLAAITSNKKRWTDLMMIEELKIIEHGSGNPSRHGMATAAAFFVAGFLPLIPYLFGVPGAYQFGVSIAATAASLFIVGAARTIVTGTHPLRSGFEMLLVGGLAAGAAYAVGAIVTMAVGIAI
jgi:VIT1/CCC1 family predicted Fe2+/Mn2+ transporter